MYEIALVEWHLTPEYINSNWTEELLTLMFLKRKVRFDKMNKATTPPVNRISNEKFFNKHKVNYRRVSK